MGSTFHCKRISRGAVRLLDDDVAVFFPVENLGRQAAVFPSESPFAPWDA
jgi:hypothetical protein